MTFIPPVAPDITGLLTGAVDPKNANSQSLTPDGVRFDVAIGGVPFMLITDKDRPYIRQTAPIQKPQFDVSQEAGEQTLSQYWVRSQTSWHRGAGVKFYEPGTTTAVGVFESGAETFTDHRFEGSAGVDVWTREQATLLRRMILDGASSGVAYATTGKLVDGTDCVFTNEAGAVRRRSSAGSMWNYTPTGTTPVTAVCAAGSKILVGHAGGIDVGDANGTVLTALCTITPGATVTPYWCKGRIIASIGPSLYTLTLAGGAIVAGDIIHTHPDPSWVWSGVTDGPSAIYAVGYSGARSGIYMFTLQDAATGTLPKLGQAYEVGVMPTGEQITAVNSYLGGYLGIGTSKGVRVALIATNGTINYGPLILETAYPVRSLEGHGTFIYAAAQEAIDGLSGAVRINLGQPLPHEDLRFAYAFDAQTHDTGVVTSVAFYGTTNRVVLGVTGKGIYSQSATQLEPSGYILSGRVRFKTVERKAFRLADVRARMIGGSLSLTALDEGTAEVSIITLTPGNPEGTSLGLSEPAGNHEYLQFRTTLRCSADGLTGPVLESLGIKALPAPARQRLVQYPLNCVDKEQDSLGVPFGYRGYGWDRLRLLEAAEDGSVVLQCQDFTNGEKFSAAIEQSEFTRVFGRARDGYGNFGGTLRITLRKL